MVNKARYAPNAAMWLQLEGMGLSQDRVVAQSFERQSLHKISCSWRQPQLQAGSVVDLADKRWLRI